MGSDVGSFCWGVVLGQIFLECPSPLSLLLLRLHDVSIGGISDDSGDLSDLDLFLLHSFGQIWRCWG